MCIQSFVESLPLFYYLSKLYICTNNSLCHSCRWEYPFFVECNESGKYGLRSLKTNKSNPSNHIYPPKTYSAQGLGGDASWFSAGRVTGQARSYLPLLLTVPGCHILPLLLQQSADCQSMRGESVQHPGSNHLAMARRPRLLALSAQVSSPQVTVQISACLQSQFKQQPFGVYLPANAM